MSASIAASTRQKQVASDLIITGGLSGQADIPKYVRIVGRKVRDWFYGYDWARLTNPELSNPDSQDAFPDTYVWQTRIPTQSPDDSEPEGNDVVINSCWCVNVATSVGSSVETIDDFKAFVEICAQQCLIPWMKESLDITYAGIPKLLKDAGGAAETYFLTGFDDWALISVCGDKVTTRVQSLMNGWVPQFIVAQDPNNITHYGPAFFISDADIPKATLVGSEWKLGQGRAYFMWLRPADGPGWKVKRSTVYANVHNSLGTTKAKANWPMQAKFIDGIWMIDVAECVT
jgi:hypothetical protein